MEKETRNGLFMFVEKKVNLTQQCQKRNDFKVMDLVYLDYHQCVIAFSKFIIYIDFRNKNFRINCQESQGNYQAISRLLIPSKIGIQLIQKLADFDRDDKKINISETYTNPFTFAYSEYNSNFRLMNKKIQHKTVFLKQFDFQQLQNLSDLIYFSQHNSKQKQKSLNQQLLHGQFMYVYDQETIKIDDYSKYLTIKDKKIIQIHDKQLQNSQLYTLKFNNEISQIINFKSCAFITNTQGITIKKINNQNSLFFFDLINLTNKQLGIYFPNSQMVYFGKQDKQKSIIMLTVHKQKKIYILFYDYLKNIITGEIVGYSSFFTPFIKQKRSFYNKKRKNEKRDISININRRIAQDFSCILDIGNYQNGCELIYHKKVSQESIIMHLCKKTNIFKNYGNQMLVRLIRLMI